MLCVSQLTAHHLIHSTMRCLSMYSNFMCCILCLLEAGEPPLPSQLHAPWLHALDAPRQQLSPRPTFSFTSRLHATPFPQLHAPWLHATPSVSRRGFSFPSRLHATPSASRQGFTPHPQLHAKASRPTLSFTPRLPATPSASHRGFTPPFGFTPRLHTTPSLPSPSQPSESPSRPAHVAKLP